MSANQERQGSDSSPRPLVLDSPPSPGDGHSASAAIESSAAVQSAFVSNEVAPADLDFVDTLLAASKLKSFLIGQGVQVGAATIKNLNSLAEAFSDDVEKYIASGPGMSRDRSGGATSPLRRFFGLRTGSSE